ncbi:hypothetical protein AX15_006422 [Amanita polypyramis BW_CC]|nr:hypothetical protein AX15_006422 [Amanita polypyramis BW_CC]
MSTEYLTDGMPQLQSTPPIVPPPVDAPAGTEITATIVEPKEDVMPKWSTHSSPSLDPTCVTMLIGQNTPTRTKSILVTPSKRHSLLPCASSQPPSRTSSATTSSCTPADGTATTTPERANSITSLNQDFSEQEDEKTLKESRLYVKFAPLPEMAPRKRRGMPLGVAARSRLVRRRRAIVIEGGTQQYIVSTPMWTDEEMEEQRERLAREWEKERERREYYSEVGENGELEDPISAFGKFVKHASKNFWNKVASRDGKESSKPEKDKEEQMKINESAEKDETGEKQEQGETSPDSGTGESDSGKPSQRSDGPSSLSGTPETGPPVEKSYTTLNEKEKEDGSAFSWEDVGGKESPSLPRADNEIVTHRKYPWSRTKVQSKPKETASPAKSNNRSFVRSLKGRSCNATGADETLDLVKVKDKELLSSFSGLRRSLSF